MRKLIWIVSLLAVIGTAGGLTWWLTRPAGEATELLLYGNVDLRQIQLAFNNSERISDVKAQEGDKVKKGDELAYLDMSRLKPMEAQIEAQVAAQQEVYKKLEAGSRDEEKAQARANVAAADANITAARAEIASAQADKVNAQENFDRVERLVKVKLKDQTEVQAVSQEDYDRARANLDKARAALDKANANLGVAKANLAVVQNALDLTIKGPRDEDKIEAKKRWLDKQAQLAFLKQQIADAVLRAPCNAIVRTRLMEAGEMASPQRPVFSLAVIDPKWVRAYVSEPDLGKVRKGMTAFVSVDSFPDRKFEGWVGFISPVAEFTPKSVQTVELRTSLVYEVRVFVRDPDDQLKLGMPATVHLPLK